MSTNRRMQRSLYRDAQVHTPYGATECLPVSSISGAQFDDKLVDRIESGDGVCVGRPLEPNQVRIIRISEMAFRDLSETTEMPFGMPGEIVVTGERPPSERITINGAVMPVARILCSIISAVAIITGNMLALMTAVRVRKRKP